jgi:hypothetical protein
MSYSQRIEYLKNNHFKYIDPQYKTFRNGKKTFLDVVLNDAILFRQLLNTQISYKFLGVCQGTFYLDANDIEMMKCSYGMILSHWSKTKF